MFELFNEFDTGYLMKLLFKINVRIGTQIKIFYPYSMAIDNLLLTVSVQTAINQCPGKKTDYAYCKNVGNLKFQHHIIQRSFQQKLETAHFGRPLFKRFLSARFIVLPAV